MLKVENISKNYTKLELRGYKYKELCSILQIEQLKSNNTNGKKAQLKELERYVNILKGEKATIVIDSFKDEIQEKIDNRINNKGGNNVKFQGDISLMILDFLCNQNTNSNRTTIGYSKNYLYRLCGLTNQNYAIASNNNALLATELNIPVQEVAITFSLLNDKNYKTLTSTLNKLQKQNLLMYYNSFNIIESVYAGYEQKENKYIDENGYETIEKSTISLYEDRTRLATENERFDIMDIQYKVMTRLGHKNNRDIFKAGKWSIFYNECIKELQNKNQNIINYYPVIAIDYNMTNIISKVELLGIDIDLDSIRKKINSKYLNSIDETIITTNNKYKNEDKANEYIEKLEKNSELSIDKKNNRLMYMNYLNSDDFKNNSTKIKNIVIDLDAKQIITTKPNIELNKNNQKLFYDKYKPNNDLFLENFKIN